MVYCFILLTLLVVLTYVVIRISLFLVSGYSLLENFFSLCLLFAELFILTHAVGYLFNMFKGLLASREEERGIERKIVPSSYPAVAVFVPARHEPKVILENTFTALVNLNYPNKDIYLLDDSTDMRYQREAEDIAREYKIKLFRRDQRHGAKAGIINDCMKNVKAPFVAIFDADQNPMPDFLKVLIPFMEEDPKLAFIQTPQFYTNIGSGRIARGAAFQQTVFYEYICEGKSSGNAMFCCGTNIVFRSEALRQVGGLDEATVTEDFATSVTLHSHGWKSLYYNHVYAFGIGPESLSSYFKQQFRWAIGTMTVVKHLVWRFFTRPFSLSLVQWWEYLLSSSYYFIGFAFFSLMICPIMYILFDVPSYFIKPEIYFFAFIPYIILSMSLFYRMLRYRHYKPGDLFLGQLLGMCTFSVYMRAAGAALLGMKASFDITEKKKIKAIPYAKLWPQICMAYLNAIAIVWAVNRFMYERDWALLMNGFWAFYHLVVLSSLFYFNED